MASRRSFLQHLICLFLPLILMSLKFSISEKEKGNPVSFIQILKNVSIDKSIENSTKVQTSVVEMRSNENNQNLTTSQRKNKQAIIPIFGVGLVQFANGVCTGAGNLMGTCYTRRQCNETNGTPSSRCANSIGVCCVIYRSCGQTTNINNTYLVSAGFPTAFTGNSVCTYTIQKIDNNVCQLRIDFLTLRLSQPNLDGVCVTDALVVTGGASTTPILCGDNTGQHMYVDFNGNQSIIISIATTGAVFNRGWNIRVSQINCNCPTRAPSGCLQFFNTTTGTVQSFNFGNTPPQNGTRQLVNQNYGICIAMVAGFCGITWAQSNANSFAVMNNTYTSIQDGTIGTINAEQFGIDCTTDFVVVPSPILVANTSALPSDRFCGNGFATITSNSKPFVLNVITNGNEMNDMGNVGFSLTFTQTRCPTVVNTQ